MKSKKSLFALYVFSFLKSLQFFGAVAVPFYLYRVKLNYAEMFTLEMIFSVAMFLFEIPTGVVADKFGRKISLFLGALAFGGGFCIFGISVSWPVLAFAEIICACGMCLMSGADRAIIYELVKKDSAIDNATQEAAKITARYDAFGTAGMLLAFPAGTLFAGSGILPYETALGVTFLASGVAIILAGLIVLTVDETLRVPLQGSAIRAGIDGFRFIFKKPALRSFSLNYAVVSSLTFFMFWFYQSLLIENAFPVSYMGFIAAGFNALAMVMLLATERILKTFGTGKTLFLSSLIPGLLYLGVFFVSGLPMALVAIFGVTVLKMFRAPVLSSLMNEHIADENRATVLSGVSMLERILTAFFYPLVGLLTDISLGWTFLVIGIITTIVSVFLKIDDAHIV
jgi:MFS family permease